MKSYEKIHFIIREILGGYFLLIHEEYKFKHNKLCKHTQHGLSQIKKMEKKFKLFFQQQSMATQCPRIIIFYNFEILKF